jgi:hypothetical protein
VLATFFKATHNTIDRTEISKFLLTEASSHMKTWINNDMSCTHGPSPNLTATPPDIRVTCKITLSFALVFGPPIALYPVYQQYLQSKEILLNLSMKCWNSAINAQGSRVLIIVVHVGAVKISVALNAGAQEKGKTGWNSHPAPLNANVLVLKVRKWLLIYKLSFTLLEPCCLWA